MSVERRIAALERENADLRGQIEAMKLLLPANKPALPRREEPQVRITHPQPRVTLPNREQARQLCEIVFKRYPFLRPSRGDEEDFFGEFCSALRFVEHQGRRAEPDRAHDFGYWLAAARSWLSQHGGGGLVSGASLAVAIVASGDIPHSDPSEPGFVVGLFIAGGREASARWHDVLTTGKLLEPTPPARQAPLPSPSRVTVRQ